MRIAPSSRVATGFRDGSRVTVNAQGMGLHQVAVVQSLGRVCLLLTPWTVARQAPLSSTLCRSLLKFMSTELYMLSNHLILCCPLLLSPSIFPSIRVFSNESALRMRWPKYWSFSFNISASNEYSGFQVQFSSVQSLSHVRLFATP